MLKHLPLVSILVLLGAAAGMLVIRLRQPKFKFFWLLTALASLISWSLLLVSRSQIPTLISLGGWSATDFYPGAAVLLLDGFSWAYGMGVISLGVAVVLSDVVRVESMGWSTWASCLVMVALGLLAVMAGDQITLLLAWAAIDIFELLLWMTHVHDSPAREKIVIAFSMRALGLLAVFVLSESGINYLIAIILRLGVIPFHIPGMELHHIRRGLGTIMRLVPAVANMVILVRVSVAEISQEFNVYLLMVAFVGASYFGWRWLLSRDELDGRPYWILAFSNLSFAAALRGQLAASIMFGLVMLLEGGMLFIYSIRKRSFIVLVAIAVAGLSTLPFTPGWDMLRIYATPLEIWMLVYLVPQILLVSGFIRHALRGGEVYYPAQRVTELIYIWNIVILLSVHFTIAMWQWPLLLESGTNFTYNYSRNPVEVWAGIVILGLSISGYFIWKKVSVQPLLRTSLLPAWSLSRAFYRTISSIYLLMSHGVNALTILVEGEGGILWTLLLLTLLLAFFAMSSSGGGF